MEKLPEILELTYFNNTVKQYLISAAIFFGFIILFFILKQWVLSALTKWVKKTRTDVDDEMLDLAKTIPWPVYFFASLFFSVQVITIHSLASTIIKILLVIFLVYWATKVSSRLIEYLLFKFSGGSKERGKKNTAYYAFALMAKIILWSTGLLLILSNLGVNISALVASLGIGGIAVALALQNVLGDIFSSFTIYLDKPFEPGDYIVIGDHEGTVKKIGLKTTRIEALQGEEIVVSNNELTNTRIRNFKRMKKRRVVFSLGLTYGTAHKKLINIPKIIEKLITEVEKCTFDRANFKEFGEFSLNYEVVYYLESNNYKEYMERQEAINLAIVEAFEKEGLEMAFPTQTLYVRKEA